MNNSKRVVNLRDRSNKIALALASIHFYSGICTGTGNIFIGDFCMNMLRWFWESTPKWLSFKMRLSFWLQLTYWYDQMRNKDWHFRVAWPGGELSTSRVTGRCLFLYLIFLSQQVLYFLLSTLVLTLYIDVVLSLSTTCESVNYDGFTRTLSSVNIKSTNFEEKNHTRDITGTGTFTKCGPTLSPKDRLWTSFSVRCLQYIPSKENGQMWKLGSGLGFPYGGLQ